MDHNIKAIADTLREISVSLKTFQNSVDFNLQNISNTLKNSGVKTDKHLSEIQDVLLTTGAKRLGLADAMSGGLYDIGRMLSDTLHVALVGKKNGAVEKAEAKETDRLTAIRRLRMVWWKKQRPKGTDHRTSIRRLRNRE